MKWPKIICSGQPRMDICANIINFRPTNLVLKNGCHLFVLAVKFRTYYKSNLIINKEWIPKFNSVVKDNCCFWI